MSVKQTRFTPIVRRPVYLSTGSWLGTHSRGNSGDCLIRSLDTVLPGDRQVREPSEIDIQTTERESQEADSPETGAFLVPLDGIA